MQLEPPTATPNPDVPADWWAFHGDRNADEKIAAERRSRLGPAPPWRPSRAVPDNTLYTPRPEPLGETYRCGKAVIEMVNAALVLRRPLLITGEPGSGKSSLAYAVARELGLGRVLRWNITSRTTLRDGLYSYDALGRLQASDLGGDSDQVAEIGQFITLGPLGTALLPWSTPRVLLIDEIDKSDVDLPNDLLHVFEEGEFEIPELVRHPDPDDRGVRVWPDKADRPPLDRTNPVPPEQYQVTVHRGRVQCSQFPFVVLTSNAEREFPPAFLRRCLRLRLPRPGRDQLKEIVRAHFSNPERPVPSETQLDELISRFLKRRDVGALANDQLLQALFLRLRGGEAIDSNPEDDLRNLINRLLHPLNQPEAAVEPDEDADDGCGRG